MEEIEKFKEITMTNYKLFQKWQNELYQDGYILKDQLLNNLELFYMVGSFQAFTEDLSLIGANKEKQKKYAKSLNERIKALEEEIGKEALDYYIEGFYKALDDNEFKKIYTEYYNNLDFEKTKTSIYLKENTINILEQYEEEASMKEFTTEDYNKIISENKDVLLLTDQDEWLFYRGGKNV